MREWPYPPITTRSAPRSLARDSSASPTSMRTGSWCSWPERHAASATCAHRSIAGATGGADRWAARSTSGARCAPCAAPAAHRARPALIRVTRSRRLRHTRPPHRNCQRTARPEPACRHAGTPAPEHPAPSPRWTTTGRSDRERRGRGRAHSRPANARSRPRRHPFGRRKTVALDALLEILDQRRRAGLQAGLSQLDIVRHAGKQRRHARGQVDQTRRRQSEQVRPMLARQSGRDVDPNRAPQRLVEMNQDALVAHIRTPLDRWDRVFGVILEWHRRPALTCVKRRAATLRCINPTALVAA